VTLDCLVRAEGSALTLSGNNARPAITLAPLQAEDKIQRDHQTGALRPVEPQEVTAFADLAAQVQRSGGTLSASVTGPLLTPPETVQVREFTALPASDT
jgi:hypothetical protein